MTSERCLALLFGWCSSIVWLGVIKWLRGGEVRKGQKQIQSLQWNSSLPCQRERERERSVCVCIWDVWCCCWRWLGVSLTFIDCCPHSNLHCTVYHHCHKYLDFLPIRNVAHIIYLHYLLLIMRYDYLWPVKTHNDMACRKSYMIDLAFPRI